MHWRGRVAVTAPLTIVGASYRRRLLTPSRRRRLPGNAESRVSSLPAYFGNSSRGRLTRLHERLKLMQLQNLARTEPFDQVDLFPFEEPTSEAATNAAHCLSCWRRGFSSSAPYRPTASACRAENRCHQRAPGTARHSQIEPPLPMFAHLLTISSRYSLAQILSQRNFGVNKRKAP